MDRLILVKYGEIILKGLNRSNFEYALVGNIKTAINGTGRTKISKVQATIYIEPLDSDDQIEKIIERLKKVFGIVSIVVAYKTEKNMESIRKCALEILAIRLKTQRHLRWKQSVRIRNFHLNHPSFVQSLAEIYLKNTII